MEPLFEQDEDEPNVVMLSVALDVGKIACYDIKENVLPIQKISLDDNEAILKLNFEIRPTVVERITEALTVLEDAEAHFRQIIKDCEEDGVDAGQPKVFIRCLDVIKNGLKVYRDHAEEEIDEVE